MTNDADRNTGLSPTPGNPTPSAHPTGGGPYLCSGEHRGGVCAKVLPPLLQGLQFSLLFCFRLNQLVQGFTHTQWVSNDPETLTSESQVLRNSGCLHETEGSSGPRRALREATGLGRVAGHNKNPGSKGAQSNGAGASADLEIRG